jgi:hypothetical protein
MMTIDQFIPGVRVFVYTAEGTKLCGTVGDGYSKGEVIKLVKFDNGQISEVKLAAMRFFYLEPLN